MACVLYVAWKNQEIRVGQFRNREQAETYWERSKQIYRRKDGTPGNPIYVETKKGRGN